jgi:hypothetical protein
MINSAGKSEEREMVFIVDDDNDKFYNITEIIPKAMKYWSKKYGYECGKAIAIIKIMADAGCNRYVIGNDPDEVVKQILEGDKNEASK